MRLPKTCKCHPAFCGCEEPLIVVRSEGGRVVEMRGATDEEKRAHKVERLRYSMAYHEAEMLRAEDELAHLGAL
jgi:hypothetical protein